MNSGRLLQARDLSEADLPWCYDLMLRGRDQVTCDYGYPTLRRPSDFSVEILARRQLLTGFAFGLADRPIGFLRIGEVTHTGYGAVCWLVDQSAMPSQLFYERCSQHISRYLSRPLWRDDVASEFSGGRHPARHEPTNRSDHPEQDSGLSASPGPIERSHHLFPQAYVTTEGNAAG